MITYEIHKIHRVAPGSLDVGEVDLPGGCFSDSRALAGALRDAGVLQSGARLRSFRVEADRVLAFPDRGIWHCIVIKDAS